MEAKVYRVYIIMVKGVSECQVGENAGHLGIKHKGTGCKRSLLEW